MKTSRAAKGRLYRTGPLGSRATPHVHWIIRRSHAKRHACVGNVPICDYPHTRNVGTHQRQGQKLTFSVTFCADHRVTFGRSEAFGIRIKVSFFGVLMIRFSLCEPNDRAVWQYVFMNRVSNAFDRPPGIASVSSIWSWLAPVVRTTATSRLPSAFGMHRIRAAVDLTVTSCSQVSGRLVTISARAERYPVTE